MDRNKRERLEKAGWVVGSAEEFLGLSDGETALVEADAGTPRPETPDEDSAMAP